MEEQNPAFQATEPEDAADEGYPGVLEVRDIMSPVEISIPASTPVEAALRTMRARGAEAAVVIEDDEPIGVVTLEDLMLEASRG